MPERESHVARRLRYRFENTLSKGTIAIIGWLALLSTAIVMLAALILAAMRVGQDPADHEHPYGFFEGMWQSMLRTLDPGVVAGDNGWQLRLLMMIVTIGGIFIVSILIGTITSGLEARLAELRKGRSRVIEKDFTLILGWSSKVYSIIGELLIANSNQKDPCIVILSERDKIEMEDEIRAKFPSTREHARHLPQRQSARSRRPRGGRSALGALHHRAGARDRKPRHPRYQVRAGHHQQPGAQVRAVPHRRRDPRAAESRGRGAGRRQGDYLRPGRRPDRTRHRADLPAVRFVGGLHRAARFRWR